jgi:hypothetical protein
MPNQNKVFLFYLIDRNQNLYESSLGGQILHFYVEQKSKRATITEYSLAKDRIEIVIQVWSLFVSH